MMMVNFNSTEPKRLNIISISDVHLGHNKTKTSNTIEGIKKTLFESSKLKLADVLIIGGDWTHTNLSFADRDAMEIYVFMVVLLQWCKDRGIRVRVLKGTPSHDWDQCEWFEKINHSQSIGCDLKYFKEVAIDRMDDLGIDVLYIPDEWKGGPEDAWEDANRCMSELGITKVDITVVHGTFDHHLPEFVKTHKHSGVAYSDITRYVVLIAHIHTHSILGKLATNGSFDRTAHGEEEPKGLIFVEINKATEKAKLTFVENKFTTTYKTIDCKSMDLEDSYNHIKKCLSGISEGNVRLRVSDTSELNSSVRELYAKYPNFSWKKETVNSDSCKLKIQENIKFTFNGSSTFNVDKDNIFEMFRNELTDLESDTAEEVMHKLELVVNNGS